MRTYIIAEAGVNHNGSLERAKKMIHVAARAGADAIKFQTFRAQNLACASAPKASYQLKTTKANESQCEMLKKLELSESAHSILVAHAQKENIEFLSTPFDEESAEFLLDRCDLSRIKISSGDITNAPLLLKIAQSKKSVILSTGMCVLQDIEAALGVLAHGYLGCVRKPCVASFMDAYVSREGQNMLRSKVSLLHCTTEYPAAFDQVNLKCMDTMRQAFQLAVGYSDHTQGIAIPLAAVAIGACMIEKHFTLDRSLPGPDHKASLEPIELEQMVCGIRQIERAMGDGIKYPSAVEMENRKIVRKSLTAGQRIEAGELFTKDNLTLKRPGDGVVPVHYWEWLDRKAERRYQLDEQIEWNK